MALDVKVHGGPLHLWYYYGKGVRELKREMGIYRTVIRAELQL